MEKISVAIICKNAQNNFRQCLKSILWANEIIIVDSGSTDKTLDIAQKFKVRIFQQKWLGYAKQKNLAISKAKNNWILSIDADEVLEKELIDYIKNADFNNFDGFYLIRKNFFGKKWIKHCGWYPDKQLRLFKKNKMKFEEKAVHEQVMPVGKISTLSGNILHYSYADSQDYFHKFENYTTLDAKILYSKKRRWSLAYQIGKPLKEFWQMYIEKQGFLDGWLGFKICIFSAYYRWAVAVKLKGFYHAYRS